MLCKLIRLSCLSVANTAWIKSGSIIQGHTNLTEIKTAAELLWRVDTDPSKVVMGFGFYGRTFTLSDSSCTSPGCSFSEGGKAGSCTDQSGYLAYYEVADILQKNPSISPMHDEDAAVLYFSWDDDQWISYDNETTFKQKLDWASEVGIGGSLIWASDQGEWPIDQLKPSIEDRDRLLSDFGQMTDSLYFYR